MTVKRNMRLDMYEPKVSLIVPMYMCEDYVDNLLDMLCRQDFSDIEIISVVDGSSDRTFQLAEAYAKKDSRIRVFEQEHMGAGAARNFGITQAKGEYLMFPDADDEYESNYVSRLFEAIDKNHADMAICHFTTENYALGTKAKSCGYRCALTPKDRPIRLKDYKNKIKIVAAMPHNKIYRHDMVQKNELCFSNTYSCNDVLFSKTTLLCADTIVFIDDHLLTYKYLKQADSISATRDKHPEDVVTVYREYYEWLKVHQLEKDYLARYCREFSGSFRYNASHSNNETFTRMITHELSEEEPWKEMSDRELSSRAMLYCGVEKETLRKCKKALLSRNLTPRRREVLTNRVRLSENAVRNYSEIVSILREEYGRNIRLNEGYLPMRLTQVRQNGVLCSLQIVYRKIKNRVL